VKDIQVQTRLEIKSFKGASKRGEKRNKKRWIYLEKKKLDKGQIINVNSKESLNRMGGGVPVGKERIRGISGITLGRD